MVVQTYVSTNIRLQTYVYTNQVCEVSGNISDHVLVFRVFDIYIDDMYKYDIYRYMFLYCWIGLDTEASGSDTNMHLDEQYLPTILFKPRGADVPGPPGRSRNSGGKGYNRQAARIGRAMKAGHPYVDVIVLDTQRPVLIEESERAAEREVDTGSSGSTAAAKPASSDPTSKDNWSKWQAHSARADVKDKKYGKGYARQKQHNSSNWSGWNSGKGMFNESGVFLLGKISCPGKGLPRKIPELFIDFYIVG
jgi:hypothetical protein